MNQVIARADADSMPSATAASISGPIVAPTAEVMTYSILSLVGHTATRSTLLLSHDARVY